MTRKGYEEQTWFTFSYSPLRDDDGGAAGMFCVCTETTATVLAERERLGEAERLRQLFDNAPGFMAVVRGPDHVFEMANASYQILVGRSDLIGKPVREAVPEVEGQGLFEAARQGLSKRQALLGAVGGRQAPALARRPPRGAAARLRLPADLRAERSGQRHLRRRLRRHRADRRRDRASRKRGAFPADRGFGAGADVGDQARPQAQLRQPRLCRVPRNQLRGSDRLRLADGHPSGRFDPGRRRIHGRRGLARDVRAGRPLPQPRRMALGPLRLAAALGTAGRAYAASSASPTTSPS